MNRKTLIALTAIAVLMLVAAILVQRMRSPVAESDLRTDESGRALMPGLAAKLNDVRRVQIVGAGEKTIATLERGEKGWTLVEKGGYPADTGKLRAFLLALAEANKLEAKTAKPESHAALALEDVKGADAKSVRVRIEGAEQPLALIIGKPSGTAGTYVRFPDQAQSWLVSGVLSVPKDAADWLARDLAEIAPTRIADVVVDHGNGERVHALKTAATADASLQLQDVPKGRTASAAALNDLATLFDHLRFDDVMAANEAMPPAAAKKIRYTTVDGVVLDATLWPKDEKHAARFTASLDEAVAGTHIDDAQAKAKAAHLAAIAAATQPSAADAKPAQKPAEPLAVSDPAKDREQTLAALREEVERLNRGFEGWTFILPAYKGAAFDKSRDALLEPLPTPAAKTPAAKPASKPR